MVIGYIYETTVKIATVVGRFCGCRMNIA